MEINPEGTIYDVLVAAKQNKKAVNILVSNGKVYKGSVMKVGAHYVRVTLSDQMSFYDAFIRLDHISAVEIPVR